MNIHDYRIVTGVLHAYIARPVKKGQVIFEPQRTITEGEIMHLIEWWVDRELTGTEEDTRIINKNGQPIIKLKRLKNNDI